MFHVTRMIDFAWLLRCRAQAQENEQYPTYKYKLCSRNKLLCICLKSSHKQCAFLQGEVSANPVLEAPCRVYLHLFHFCMRQIRAVHAHLTSLESLWVLKQWQIIYFLCLHSISLSSVKRKLEGILKIISTKL